ncbi:copia protein [Tanacetum coccineum]
MDNVEEKKTRIRILGPTGIFKDDPPQEYIRKRNFDDVNEDDDFQSSLWVKPNVLGDMNVTLKDPSGTTFGTIHYKVLSSEDGYAKDIKVGPALILRNVFVFCDKPKNYALNMTIKNLVKIIKKDTVVEDADGASSSKI